MNAKELLKKGEANLIYEDNLIQIIFPEKGFTEGHLIVIPKKDANTVDEINDEEMEILTFASNYASMILFQITQGQGTNILMEENPLQVHVISRKQNDGINFFWQPKKLDPAEMDSVENNIKDATFMIGKEKNIDKSINNKNENNDNINNITDENIPLEVKKEDEKENYLIKQLTRIP